MKKIKDVSLLYMQIQDMFAMPRRYSCKALLPAGFLFKILNKLFKIKNFFCCKLNFHGV